MLFVIYCLDKPGAQQVRLDTRPAHVAYLKDQGPRVVMGGPMTTEDGGAMTGSMLVVDVETYAEAEAFSRNDPYALAGLFDTVSIRPWKKVIPA